MGTVLFCAANIFVLIGLVWSSARRMSREHDERSTADLALRELNAALEGRIAERTSNLEMLNERLSLATAVARVGVWEWNLATETVTWDAMMFEIYGFPALAGATSYSRSFAPMPLETWSAAICPEDLPLAEAALRKVIDEKGQGSMEFRIVRKDGTVRCLLAMQKVILDGRGDACRLIGVNTDITAGKQREQELSASLATSDHALKKLADQQFALDQHAIVAVTDVQGTIVYANDKFCAISQYSREELIGQNHRILNSGHHPKEFFRQMYQTIGNGQVWHDEICNRAKDGSIYWVDATIVPFLDQDGKPRQYVAIRTDITGRKNVEAALVTSHTNQIRFKDEFLSHVSHELRSPLTAIKQFANILLCGWSGELSPEQREFLQIVLKNVLQLQSMIDDLLEVTRLETGKLSVEPESVSVADAATYCFRPSS